MMVYAGEDMVFRPESSHRLTVSRAASPCAADHSRFPKTV